MNSFDACIMQSFSIGNQPSENNKRRPKLKQRASK